MTPTGGGGVLDALGQVEDPDRNHNDEAAVFAQAAAEIGQMVRLLGGRPEPPLGPAGMGERPPAIPWSAFFGGETGAVATAAGPAG